ncbi:uncharacterized protein LOC125455567 [Stegostoma tigrinum]|uniref:uncharacterized protein LOC125455567 n=1 Tax=Stegostoma tigrinum TaxID=3053191 RepID=UPI00202B8FFC|nr:uncharacterized protein LOC125455567 [Stegostoma tigrinum]XP_048393666.1 uncharacterized protein LOC125455567 [Stegostoma tigrinum]XP_048393674.1 uncharacterized protein LOC125455567 [Stegostoma tigrinum]XP_048393684.1 uncharacterized protein LOC125455567 [Stegostoma tigrinum]XP_048393693.1 uncharacterized protein LOC125455567 [Stegostoma tigrinum]XP_059507370.1 uncharacterized protein LOC125455567 [Stegostoma tigrinum]XP_059507372.1 uncharacterized protein LOC125455567 [Stegostoma tigrinu
MGCRCCRMIRRYIFGPTIVRELPPNSVKNEKNYRNNDIKHEASFHNSSIKTNNIVTSTLDKVINLEEQNIEITRKEMNVTRAEEKTVEGVEDNTDNVVIRALNNKLAHPESYTVTERDEITQTANTGNCSSNNNIRETSEDELTQHHDPETESDCQIVNGPSTEHPTEAENIEKACEVHEGGDKTTDKKIDFVNNSKLLHMQNNEVNRYNLETDTEKVKSSSNQSSNSEMNTINVYEDLENTPSSITDEAPSNDLFEEVKLWVDGEDPEVVAALAALEAATAGQDDDLED